MEPKHMNEFRFVIAQCVVGNRDRVSQQIQIKLGDYQIAQTLLDDPSKSIGICAEPPSPAPCEYTMQNIM
ncbi:hypothetical protein RR46_01485 [Papilio xuthus]|uniref:Uncharacterized protein n=1 Tax=Papilio xuthus TaxID=66420 RepID=A0A0N1ID99_PAPXU|nr:hypothetical protein RR46_01485 [Papilio xuthus]